MQPSLKPLSLSHAQTSPASILPKTLVSSTSGLGDLENIGAMQLRLMRMKKRAAASVNQSKPEQLTASDDQPLTMQSKRSKEGSLKGVSRRKDSLNNSKRSKSSKRESGLP